MKLEVHYLNDEVKDFMEATPHNPENVGLDLVTITDIKMEPGKFVMADTGLIARPPVGYYIEVVARSSAYKKYGITMPNSVGVIDPLYCGEKDYIKVPLLCTTYGLIPKGSRIAQAKLMQLNTIDELVEFNPSEESRGGFGSTGE